MLYPKMNRSRTIVDLGGLWKFKLGDETEPGESWTELQDADIIYVPASFNDQKEDPGSRFLRLESGTGFLGKDWETCDDDGIWCRHSAGTSQLRSGDVQRRVPGGIL